MRIIQKNLQGAHNFAIYILVNKLLEKEVDPVHLNKIIVDMFILKIKPKIIASVLHLTNREINYQLPFPTDPLSFHDSFLFSSYKASLASHMREIDHELNDKIKAVYQTYYRTDEEFLNLTFNDAGRTFTAREALGYNVQDDLMKVQRNLESKQSKWIRNAQMDCATTMDSSGREKYTKVQGRDGSWEFERDKNGNKVISQNWGDE
ncbi:MAG: hypothetical protein HOG49_08235 [Candidatus Scalindua sp.]|jgi:hypothetical protein|nr:hypothetical protein [Candidatus Scalindua sp.]